MTYLTASNKTVRGRDGSQFNYRETGAGDGLPLVLLNHLSATLDNWDPRFIDALSHHRKVIVFDNRALACRTVRCQEQLKKWPLTLCSF